MKKRIRIHLNIPIWSPCIRAMNGDEVAEGKVRAAVAALNAEVNAEFLIVTVKDK